MGSERLSYMPVGEAITPDPANIQRWANQPAVGCKYGGRDGSTQNITVNSGNVDINNIPLFLDDKIYDTSGFINPNGIFNTPIVFPEPGLYWFAYEYTITLPNGAFDVTVWPNWLNEVSSATGGTPPFGALTYRFQGASGPNSLRPRAADIILVTDSDIRSNISSGITGLLQTRIAVSGTAGTAVLSGLGLTIHMLAKTPPGGRF